MDESRGWTVNGERWRERVATVGEQRRVPIVDARTIRLSQDNMRRSGGGRVKVRRVHPSVVERMMGDE